jgi:hypothetical protein
LALRSRDAPWWSVALAAANLGRCGAIGRDGSVPFALGLLVLGALNAARPKPETPADDGSSLEDRRWREAQATVWTGAALGALLAPWTVWAGVALVGLSALLTTPKRTADSVTDSAGALEV